MRDKEWLKEKVQTMIDEEYRCYDPLIQQRKHTCRVIMDLIEQIDEPEKLSEEWINEHSKSYTMENAVEISDLKNLLLPQPKKPVIPQFVADWIEECKEVKHNLYGVLDFAPTDVEEWLFHTPEKSERVDLIARAWLDGYTTEKEKLYRVRVGKSYVRFNLDGSIIGAKAVNSVVTLDRLSKLPFDYKKAVESGIITLVEVTK